LIGALRSIGWLWERLSPDLREKIAAVLAFAFGKTVSPVDALAFVLFANLAASAVLFVLGLRPTSILVLVVIGIALPVFLFQRAAGNRARELELALPLALQQVANEMAAGATLEIALKKTAATAPEPADVEIARLQRRVEIMGIDEAFAEMARRLNSRSFTLTASVVRVGTSSGGRLIEALKNLSRTLIEIERLNKKIRTASENGRRNLYLMSLIGPLVAIGSALVVDHETSVFEDGLGQLLVSIAVLGFLSAHVIGHLLTKAKV
jgi:tight adherence protein B